MFYTLGNCAVVVRYRVESLRSSILYYQTLNPGTVYRSKGDALMWWLVTFGTNCSLCTNHSTRSPVPLPSLSTRQSITAGKQKGRDCYTFSREIKPLKGQKTTPAGLEPALPKEQAF